MRISRSSFEKRERFPPCPPWLKAFSTSAFHSPHLTPALVRPDIAHWMLARVRGREQIRPREAVHVASDRHAHVVEHRRREIDDRAAAQLGVDDVGAVSE